MLGHILTLIFLRSAYGSLEEGSVPQNTPLTDQLGNDYSNNNHDAANAVPLILPMISHSALVERRRLEGHPIIENETGLPPRKLRARHLTSTSVAPLYQGIGTHYVDLWVGTPTPQRQTVIVDTGSGVTAFPCTGCRSCGQVEHHIDDVYNTDSSTSFRELDCSECLAGSCNSHQCSVSRMYSEGSSWRAHECQDWVYAGGEHDQGLEQPDSWLSPWNPLSNTNFGLNLKFGCQTSVTKLFLTQWADGIMGMNTAGKLSMS